ncbi:HIT domain-containing protein [Methanonatronarchaeum sp. AMET-Sl]|uniref:HIT family protein n=1 Tax=Methanonatronarchaeum sp. AMET-Sl TaxID=3037654 RepID=UPI00244E5008|nr:HIT domain-containing protein [Methanonatronarchaeum sp. AMET-Sl]WGI18138.1 HIT domain-containing protein [Methanonatronarchaeum sp. AMET-Sl]
MMMERIYAPWRIKYVRKAKEGDVDCVFCSLPTRDEHRDRENLILYRGEKCFLVLNKYPYNPGHALVAPYRHTSDYTSRTEEEVLESQRILSGYIKAAEKVFEPDGFNVGTNLGRVAGAGIETHIHQHIVPRWEGDSNFMPVIGETRVISQDLKSSYDEIKKELEI